MNHMHHFHIVLYGLTQLRNGEKYTISIMDKFYTNGSRNRLKLYGIHFPMKNSRMSNFTENDPMVTTIQSIYQKSTIQTWNKS